MNNPLLFHSPLPLFLTLSSLSLSLPPTSPSFSPLPIHYRQYLQL